MYFGSLRLGYTIKTVSGQLSPKENCPPPIRVGVLVEVRVSFKVGG